MNLLWLLLLWPMFFVAAIVFASLARLLVGVERERWWHVPAFVATAIPLALLTIVGAALCIVKASGLL